MIIEFVTQLDLSHRQLKKRIQKECIPGVGGVDPRELELLLLERTSLRALRLDDEEPLPAYNREFLTCCC